MGKVQRVHFLRYQILRARNPYTQSAAITGTYPCALLYSVRRLRSSRSVR